MPGIRTPNTIDLITYDEQADTVKLIMTEDRMWDSEEDMYEQLQDKLNCYLVYAEDGQLESDYPDYKGKGIAIQLDMAYKPEGKILELLPRLQSVLEQRNILFQTNQIEKLM